LPAVRIDSDLVSRLVAAQFPQWARLPVTPVEPNGWDNRTFRLGPDMLVRLPSAERYAAQVAKEQRWLPVLARQLPLPIPTPLAGGVPEHGYPWNWSVYRWLEGEPAETASIADPTEFAATLAHFLNALRQADAAAGPPPGAHNFYRGGSLTVYGQQTRDAIAALGDRIEVEAVTAVWEVALASRWQRPPVWVHGDVSAANLLVAGGRLSAVIDFGCSGVGDPACDLAIAWTMLSGESRQRFRAAVGLDAATWARGRGWVLWKSLITLAGQPEPRLAAPAGRALRAVLADHRGCRDAGSDVPGRVPAPGVANRHRARPGLR
jgi:aminoglycoside phosphotransferase (APT) family kinase protein